MHGMNDAPPYTDKRFAKCAIIPAGTEEVRQAGREKRIVIYAAVKRRMALFRAIITETKPILCSEVIPVTWLFQLFRWLFRGYSGLFRGLFRGYSAVIPGRKPYSLASSLVATALQKDSPPRNTENNAASAFARFRFLRLLLCEVAALRYVARVFAAAK